MQQDMRIIGSGRVLFMRARPLAYMEGEGSLQQVVDSVDRHKGVLGQKSSEQFVNK